MKFTKFVLNLSIFLHLNKKLVNWSQVTQLQWSYYSYVCVCYDWYVITYFWKELLIMQSIKLIYKIWKRNQLSNSNTYFEKKPTVKN